MSEIVVKTDYQDIYRIIHGVLLVINKYEANEQYKNIYCHSAKSTPYNKYTQNLRILKEDYKTYNEIAIPKGTVIDRCPVVLCNPCYYTFTVKTSGEYFSGDIFRMNDYLDEIQNIIKSYLV